MEQPGVIEFFGRGPFGVGLAAAWGAIWGSFFNVLAVRLPAGESLVRPASCCRSCGAPIRWYDNIPLASYLTLRGRCRRCGARFSVRYLIVELAVAALSVAMQQVYLDLPGAGPLQLGQFFITSLFCGLLVAIAVIDIDTMLIPNAITYPGIPLCMLLSLFMQLPRPWDGPLGGAGGYLLVRLFADGYWLLTGRQGMGYGDAKLLAMIGGLLGWQVLLPVLFLSSMQGSVIGIGLLVVLRRVAATRTPIDEDPRSGPDDVEAGQAAHEGDDRDDAPGDGEEGGPSPLRHARIPFGPFLSLAAVEVLALRRRIMGFFPYLE